MWAARLRLISRGKKGGGGGDNDSPTVRGSPAHRPRGGSKLRTPWFAPREDRLQLIFFQKVFVKLLEAAAAGTDGREDGRPPGVSLLALHRAMTRLFCIIGASRSFDVKQYDLNSDGTVGWWEFCVLWKQEQLSVKYTLAERIYLTLEDPQMCKLGRIISISVLLAILISAASFIISTLPSMQTQRCVQCEPEPYDVFVRIDTVCVVLFTIEYLLRLITSAFMRSELNNQDQLIGDICTDELILCPTKPQRVWSFVRAWPNLIDLVAILPTYVAWVFSTQSTSQPGGSGGGGDSTMVLIKLTRLMRIVRAFRLGRRFQAVIIIAKAMQRSVRILWVLILNISLNMLVFGAIMYFVEQGEYDPDSQQHLRPESWTLNANTNTYERQKAASPFESIPHSFWWALVTATTVGYGDMYPTTDLGKVTAGIATVWSLCVLALPVGVIGANFERVWEEYDTERRNERDQLESARAEERKTYASIDPLSHSRFLMLEVFHDSGMVARGNDIFIGEAEIELQMEPKSFDPVHKKLCVLLHENRAKSRRKVSGELHISYTWNPCEPSQPGMELEGTLMVTIASARGLVPVDWKGSGLSDPYVMLTLYPHSPSKAGDISPEQACTSTVYDDACPVWNETKSFPFHWHREGVQAMRECERQAYTQLPPCRELSTLEPNKALGTSVAPGAGAESRCREEEGVLLAGLPQLHMEVARLRGTLPQLRNDVRQLHEGAHAILAQLCTCSLNAPVNAADGDEELPLLLQGRAEGSGQERFDMPGLVPESASHTSAPVRR